jgi:hypothetical protein
MCVRSFRYSHINHPRLQSSNTLEVSSTQVIVLEGIIIRRWKGSGEVDLPSASTIRNDH